jgi:hypothetical protein
MDRSLLAFAFLAQVNVGQTDLVSGLAPIFKPVAKANAGKRFEPGAFAEEVRKLYGLKMNPWAVEDFAPRLERAGVLQKIELPAGAHYYVYAPIQEEFPSITESDIETLAAKFRAFAEPLLAAHGIALSSDELSRILREQLIDLDFIAILIKPEAREAQEQSRSVLRLKKSESEDESRETVEREARQDVLCAAFILDVYRNEPDVYSLLVRIASGALLAEVVLEFQEPKFTGRLDTLTIFLDAPFVMSLLDLSSEESHTFATAICEELVTQGVTLATFRHCIDELNDNLKAVKSAFASGHAWGATGRRLSNPVFSAMCNAVIGNPEGRLKALKVKVVEGENLGSRFQYFTEQDETSLYAALGVYRNEVARQRDAASVAAVMRYRRGARARMAEFGNAGYVFATQNPRVVDTARRYCLRQNLMDATEVPPAITDRYLAGLLWVLFGGKAEELAPTLLLANCAAALEPRSDVIGKMHRFLSKTSEQQAETFRALMTDERAGQYLMELTLGDSGFLTQDNADELLARIKTTLIEEERGLSERRLAEQQSAHESKMAEEAAAYALRLQETEREVERGKQSFLDTEAQRMVSEARASDLKVKLDSAEDRAQQERGQRIEDRRRVIQAVVDDLLGRRRLIWMVSASLVALVAAAGTYLGLVLASSSFVRIGATVAAGAVAGLGFWKVPDLVLVPFFERGLQRKLVERLRRMQIFDVDRDFDVDLASGVVTPKEPDENGAAAL